MRIALGALFLVTAGSCGDPKYPVVDAPPAPADGAPDGAPDGPPAPVTLTITESGSPQPGVKVYFQNADSSLVSATMTDTNGVASALMVPGGFVTVMNPFAGANGILLQDVRTFAGVKPGDQLKLRQGSGGASIDVTVVVPYDSTATSYRVNTSCGRNTITPSGTGAQSGTLSLYDCPATGDVLVEMRDANGTAGFIYRANAAFVDQGTLDLSAETFQAPSTITLSYTNVPAGYATLEANGNLVMTKGPLFSDSTNATVTSGSANATAKRPANLPGATSLIDTRFFKDTLGDHHVFEWGAPGNYALDASGVLLAEYATAPALNASTRTISWTSANGVAPDFAMFLTFVQRQTPSIAFAWQLVAPYTGTAVTLPLLPGDAATYNPLATDMVDVDEMLTGKLPGGYDAVREIMFATEGPQDLITTATGRIVFEQLNVTNPSRQVPASWRVRPSRTAK